MKRWLACLGLMAVLAQPARGWQPEGWIWMAWPYAYSIERGSWIYFSPQSPPSVYRFTSAQWRVFGAQYLSSGWVYAQWPYVYGHGDGAWYYVGGGQPLIGYVFRHGQWDLAPPRFVTSDYTQLYKISQLSLFRSSEGHDYSDEVECCRSMKHYYSVKTAYLENNVVRIFSPVNGRIEYVRDEGHGSAAGLTNKQIGIRSTARPAYLFIIFHTDLISAAIAPGANVTAGQHLGYARVYYPDLNSWGSLDIAVELQFARTRRLVSFVEVLTDGVFNTYRQRGVGGRSALIISREQRDADPLTCDASEQFTTVGSLPRVHPLN